MTKIIEIFKKYKIKSIIYNFSCSRGFMGDLYLNEIEYEDSSKEVSDEDEEILSNYFNYEIYNKIEFRAKPSGHYIGECGNVIIELDNDRLYYNKLSKKEYSKIERFYEYVDFTEKEKKFLDNYVKDLCISNDSTEFNILEESITYSKDFIFTVELQKVVESINEKLKNVVEKINQQINNFDEDIEYTDDFKLVNSEDDKIYLQINVYYIKVYG